MTQTFTESVTSQNSRSNIIIPEPGEERAGHKLSVLLQTITDSYHAKRIPSLNAVVQNLRDGAGRIIYSFHTNPNDADLYAPRHRHGQALLTVWTLQELQQLAPNSLGSTYVFLMNGAAETNERIDYGDTRQDVHHATWGIAFAHLFEHIQEGFLRLTMDTAQLQQKNMEVLGHLRKLNRLKS